MKMDKTYDLIIIGSGPAGLSASIYASRYRLDHLVLGAQSGGQMSEIADIENWPGDASVAGQVLISRFIDHAESYGAKVKNELAIHCDSIQLPVLFRNVVQNRAQG